MSVARNVVLVIAVVTLVLLACAPSVGALWRLWEWSPYVDGHGPFIAAISLGLILRSRHALAATQLRPSAAGAAGLFVCGLAWFLAWQAGIEELHVALLPLVILAAVLAALGPTAARITAFPLGYLYFAEPLWHVLIGPLQELTVHVVSIIAPIIGMPVTVAGDVLRFPHSISFEVTPVCSGVNFLVVGLAGAALLGELWQASLRRRAGLILAMALLMVGSNWVRVLVIIVAGYTSDMRSVLATRGHWYLGWILFALIMFAFARVAVRGSPSSMSVLTASSPEGR